MRKSYSRHTSYPPQKQSSYCLKRSIAQLSSRTSGLSESALPTLTETHIQDKKTQDEVSEDSDATSNASLRRQFRKPTWKQLTRRITQERLFSVPESPGRTAAAIERVLPFHIWDKSGKTSQLKKRITLPQLVERTVTIATSTSLSLRLVRHRKRRTEGRLFARLASKHVLQTAESSSSGGDVWTKDVENNIRDDFKVSNVIHAVLSCLYILIIALSHEIIKKDQGNTQKKGSDNAN